MILLKYLKNLARFSRSENNFVWTIKVIMHDWCSNWLLKC